MVARRLTLLYVVVILSFSWGFGTALYRIFPWRLIYGAHAEIAAFVRGDADEKTTVVQKMLNDFGISPQRFIWDFTVTDRDGFRTLPLGDTNDRRDLPRVWMSPDAPKHARLIVGAFDFKQSFWGAVLLDPTGNVVHRWYMSGEIEALTDKPDFTRNLYGVAFFPDGSAIYTMQERGGGLVKIDACSRVLWTKKGNFHHAISPVEDRSAFWTFGGMQLQFHPKLILIDAATGATIREIDMADVAKANVGLSIFDLQAGPNDSNATHPNDIDPLPAAWANAYPRSDAGDLLLSYRTTNLIFVLDTDSLKIKWWYVGAGDGQHDPDWHENGRISLYNNNRRAERLGRELVSTIVSVDPEKNSHRTLIDGKPFEFYSSYNGNHEITADGTALITSATQGRVFEVDLASGRKTFEFVNAYDWGSDQTLHLAESFIIDDARLERWTANSCTAKSVQKGDTQ